LYRPPARPPSQENTLFISEAFAQTGAPSLGSTEGLMSMLPIVLMFGLLYFMMIRPQMKRAKEHKGMLDGLKSGDEVIAAGGVLGKIAKIGDAYVDIEIAPNTQIHVQKAAIQTLLPKGTIKSIG
jgi:preprotein translocase subunit YajC